MMLISKGHDADAGSGQWRRYAVAATAVAAAATAGSVAVDPNSAWYRNLRKPGWQPPPWAFGVVWPPLYASLTYAFGHALGRSRGPERAKTVAGFAANLALNAGWTWLFFGCRSPKAALAGTLLLDLSNAELIRRTARTDPTAARVLLPYAAWCAFATALTASISRRNRS